MNSRRTQGLWNAVFLLAVGALMASTTWAAAPSAPANLRITSATDSHVRLAWDDTSNNEDHFYIFKKNRTGPIVVTGPNETQFQIDNPPCGQRLNYRVRAVNEDGRSDFSNMVSAESRPCGTGAKPDLVVQELEINPNPVGTGQELTVGFKVVNQGNARARPSRARWQLLGSDYISFCDVPALAPNASSHCEVHILAAPLRAKQYKTVAFADHDNSVGESAQGEKNNEALLQLQVQ